MLDIETQLRAYAGEVEASVAPISESSPNRGPRWLHLYAVAAVIFVVIGGFVAISITGSSTDSESPDLVADTPSTTTVPTTTGSPITRPLGLVESVPSPLAPRHSALVVPFDAGRKVMVWGGEVTAAVSVDHPYAVFTDGAIFDVVNGSWTMMAAAPIDVSTPPIIGVSDGSTVWVVRGNQFAAYDLTNDEWERLDSVNFEVTDLFLLDGAIVAVGRAVSRYDIEADVWIGATEVATIGGGEFPRWASTGSELFGVVVDDGLYESLRTDGSSVTGIRSSDAPTGGPGDFLDVAWDGTALVVVNESGAVDVFDPVTETWSKPYQPMSEQFGESYESPPVVGFVDGRLVVRKNPFFYVESDSGFAIGHLRDGFQHAVMGVGLDGRSVWWVFGLDNPPPIESSLVSLVIPRPEEITGGGSEEAVASRDDVATDDRTAAAEPPEVVGLFADTAIRELRAAGYDVVVVFAPVPAGDATVGRVIIQSLPFDSVRSDGAAGLTLTLTIGQSVAGVGAGWPGSELSEAAWSGDGFAIEIPQLDGMQFVVVYDPYGVAEASFRSELVLRPRMVGCDEPQPARVDGCLPDPSQWSTMRIGSTDFGPPEVFLGKYGIDSLDKLLGGWVDVALSQDGATALATWSGECEARTAILINLTTGQSRLAVTNGAWSSFGLGWRADGTALVGQSGGCSEYEGTSVWSVHPDASSQSLVGEFGPWTGVSLVPYRRGADHGESYISDEDARQAVDAFMVAAAAGDWETAARLIVDPGGVSGLTATALGLADPQAWPIVDPLASYCAAALCTAPYELGPSAAQLSGYRTIEVDFFDHGEIVTATLTLSYFEGDATLDTLPPRAAG